MSEIMRRTLEQIGNALFWIAGSFSILVFIAAQTGAPPSGTVMEDCTVYGVEDYNRPVVLDADTCEKMISEQKKLYGTAVPPKNRPAWAQFVLSVAELPLNLLK